MEFFGRTATYTREVKIRRYEVEPVGEKLIRYKSNWLRHLTRINNNRMPRIMLNYRPNGRRQLGRALNGLLYEAEICL
jgi:hypothetical protein